MPITIWFGGLIGLAPACWPVEIFRTDEADGEEASENELEKYNLEWGYL
jgi:hypothetical protein